MEEQTGTRGGTGLAWGMIGIAALLVICTVVALMFGLDVGPIPD